MGAVFSTLANHYGKVFIAAAALCYFYHVHKYTMKVGTRVKCRYGGKVKWYPGKITQVNAAGTFTITYDDGDVEENVKPEWCHHNVDFAPKTPWIIVVGLWRKMGLSSPAVGDLVQADWGSQCTSKEQWMEARVTAANGGDYQVTYYDGESSKTEKDDPKYAADKKLKVRWPEKAKPKIEFMKGRGQAHVDAIPDLEGLHRYMLNCRNEANLDDMKLMITDDVTMIARGNEIAGREKVENAMIKGIEMLKGKHAMDGDKVKIESMMKGEMETRAVFTINIMGMSIKVGERAIWNKDRKCEFVEASRKLAAFDYEE